MIVSQYLLMLCVLLYGIQMNGFRYLKQSYLVQIMKTRCRTASWTPLRLASDTLPEAEMLAVQRQTARKSKAAALGIPVEELTYYARAISHETQLAKEAKAPLIWTQEDGKDIRLRVANLWKDGAYREKFFMTNRQKSDMQDRKDRLERQFQRVQAKQLYFDRKAEAAKVNALNYRTKRYLSIVQKMHLARVRVARGIPKDALIMDLLGPELWFEEKLRLQPDILRPDILLTDRDMEKALRKRWANETYTQEDLDLIESGAPMWVDLDDDRIRAHRKQSRERLTSDYYWRKAILQQVEKERLSRLANNITESSDAEVYLKEGDDGYFYKYHPGGNYNTQMCEQYNPKIERPKDRTQFYDMHTYDDKSNHIVYEPHEFLLYKKRTQPYNKIFHGKYELRDDLYHFDRLYRRIKHGDL